MILVGTKTDLRDRPQQSSNSAKKGPISFEDGVALAKKINANKYMECSAITQKGLSAIFEEAVRLTFQSEKKDAKGLKKKKAKCNLL